MAVKYNTSIVRDGLVLYLDAANPKSYPGSGTTFFNLGSNGINATLVNGPTYSSNNKGYFILDGVNDYINTNTDTYNCAQTISYEFFMKLSTVSENKVLIGKYDGAAPDMWIGITSGNQYLYAGYYSLTTNFVVTDNIFRHYVITYNSSTNETKLYVNGAFHSGTTVSARSNPRGNLMIGKFGTAANNYFPNNLPFIRIYNKALSATEVKTNFEATRGRFDI